MRRFLWRASKSISALSLARSQIHTEAPTRLQGLIQCAANYVPLSPVTFLQRAATAYSSNTSLVYGSVSYTWSQTYHRCLKLASALITHGIHRGDLVATLCPNVPAMYELHFAVPMAGAILCTLNSRHDSAMVATLLKHSETKILFVDYELEGVARGAIELLESKPEVIIVGGLDDEYERLIQSGESGVPVREPESEMDPISVNYTSGTTSRPKGVVYNYRGAYLNSLATLMMHGIGSKAVYLWTVPMFHCNGWCLVWGMAAVGGCNVCIKKVTGKGIFEAIETHKVTHMGGAPTVLSMIIKAGGENRMNRRVELMTGGAAPPPQVLHDAEKLGFSVSHLYGMTETYGPATSCEWKAEWDLLSGEERAEKRGIQGVRNIAIEEVDVRNPETLESVPSDGTTVGEVMMRGNTVMSGYLKDSEGTAAAMEGGWLRSGDLGVKHRDGYVEVRDRRKDVIVTGGENVSAMEVEAVLFKHSAVEAAAVVARPDIFWGETVCAFVQLKEGFRVSEGEIIGFCRTRLPGYMAPRSVVFQEIPTTATGKVQKFVLREIAKTLGSLAT